MKATTPSRLRSNAGDSDNEPNPVVAQLPVVVEALRMTIGYRWLPLISLTSRLRRHKRNSAVSSLTVACPEQNIFWTRMPSPRIGIFHSTSPKSAIRAFREYRYLNWEPPRTNPTPHPGLSVSGPRIPSRFFTEGTSFEAPPAAVNLMS